MYKSNYNTKASTQLDINFFEILLNTKNLVLKFTNYVDKEHLNKLRQENPDYIFYRVDKKIYIWSVKKNPSPLPIDTGTRTVTFEENPNIFSKIVQTGIDNFLGNNKIEILDDKSYIRELVTRKDLCSDIPGVALYNKLILQNQILRFGTTIKIGTIINFGTMVEFTDNIEVLSKNGVDPRGMLIKDKNGIIARIIDVEGSNLTLDTGIVIEAKEVKPIGNKDNQSHYLSSIGKTEDFQNIMDEENRADKIYEKINKFYNYLNQKKDQIYLGGELYIQDILNFAVSGSSTGLRKEQIYRPAHYYGNNQVGQKSYPNDNLQELGPFSRFKKNIKVLVLASEAHKGRTETFLKKLSQPLQTLFWFENIEFDDRYYKNTDDPVKGYESLLYQDGIELSSYDSSIIIESEKFKYLPPSKNPYYVIKAALMGDKVPSQEVEIETISQMNQVNEKFILNNIALAMYGKVGGTPWAVEKIDPLRKEFIIGIGSSTIRTESKEVKKVIGFASVFDFTGRYIVGDCSTITSVKDYKQSLKNYLNELISSLIERENVQKSQEIRLIFHLFKPAGRKNEIAAIEEVLNEFKEFQIEFAILHLSEDHNFRVFSSKGATLPTRGQLIEISDNKKILCFVNKAIHKQVRGNPAPLVLELDYRSTFKDINYLTKQAFYFSFLSARNFVPSRTPITILYPSLLANLSGMLREIPGWNYNKLALVKDKLWFI